MGNIHIDGMRFLLFLLAFIVLALPVSATMLFDDWVVSGTSFSVAGQNYSANYVERQSTAVIHGPTDNALITQGDCKTTDDYRYCFTDFDDSDRAVIANGVDHPAMHITIEQLSAVVTISRTISESSLALGKRADITVTIQNTGDKPALNVEYRDLFPSGLTVVTASGADRSPQLVKWTGTLSAKKSVTFKYTIEAHSFIDANLVATLTYTDGEMDQEIDSDSLHITTTLPFDIDQQLTPEDYVANEELTYKVTITNTLRRPISVQQFTLTVPAGVTVGQTVRGWKADANRRTLTFAGDITDTEDFELHLTIPRNGVYDLNSDLQATIDGQAITQHLQQPIRVGVSQLVPHITFTPDTPSSGGFYRLKAWVENVGSRSILAKTISLSGTAMSDRGTTLQNRDIRQHATEEILNKRLTAPSVRNTTTYVFTLSGSYEDVHNVTLPFSESATLTVEPIPDVLQIEAIPEHLAMARNGTTHMKVFVTNIGNATLNDVRMVDLLTRGLSTDGTPSATLSLEPGERKLAYDYALTVSDSYRDSVVTVKTAANAKLPGGLLYASETPTHIVFGQPAVNPEYANADVPSRGGTPDTKPGSQSNSTGTSHTIDLPITSQPGFFSRLWRRFLSLFGVST